MFYMTDALFVNLKARFSELPDHRQGEQVKFNLADVLMAGFALFSLKDSSLLQFIARFKERANNLGRVFRIKKCPSDTGMRQILDEVPPGLLLPIIGEQVAELNQNGHLSGYRVLGGYFYIPVDGTTHYSSHEVSCPHCSVKNHKNGTKTFTHAMLAAVIVHPGEEVVFPCAVEPILQQDGKKKNDCELCAMRRLLPQIVKALPKEKIIIGGDSLYPNAPLIRDTKVLGLNFLFNIKEGYQGYPYVQFNQLSAENRTNKCFNADKTHTYHHEFANNLILNGQNQDIIVNFLRLALTNKKTGEVTVFEWITNIPITVDNYWEMSKVGRSRWKIENETFNTLKNQGYEFEHNFGHGKKHLASVFAILMFLAFLVDQIQQAFDKGFRKALVVAKSKKMLWQKIREIINLIPVPDINTVYKIIAKEIKLSINLII
jgi:hypothetical protein